MNDKRKKLEELEAESREQDDAGRDRDITHAARTQLLFLRSRLLALNLYYHDEFVERATGKWKYHEESGELHIWWEIDDINYVVLGDTDGPIYLVHDVKGVREWTELDEDGDPTEWKREVPPWTTLN